MIHYECLYKLTVYLPKLKVKHRLRISFGVLGTLAAHVIEIYLFATSYYFMHHAHHWGELSGNFNGSFMDTVYFSFTTYTTLGFGDIEPLGKLRYLVGIEALVGLILITWSASFLYLEMQRYWKVQ
ncbi:MAG: potassium channel family protein [Ghiorsea sp.]|nr:potassium channel family protein [Ghiorsea sp.]